jgi:adenylosuccinate lyase
MIALLTSLEEQVGEDSRFIHIGLTTSDVRDIRHRPSAS